MAQLTIRPKTRDDDEACVALMWSTHTVDGYPRYWPARPERFLSPRQETDAWVAVLEDQDRVVGQVALHAASGDPVVEVAKVATGLAEDQLVVLARLLVDSNVRGLGIGRRLVATAVERAHARGQRPVLDVLTSATATIAFYESGGWERVGETTLSLDGLGYGDVPPLELWVYVGPPVTATT